MVYERAQLPIKPGGGPDFEKAMAADGLPLLRAAAGCRSAVLARGVEEPDTYLLLVEWDEVASHERFAGTSEFDTFRGVVGPHFAAAPSVLHFEITG